MIKTQFITIFMFVLLMASAIFIFDMSIKADQETSQLDIESSEQLPSLPTETGVFKRSEYSLNYANMDIDESVQRDLDQYYDGRAFPGAPPMIPHPLISEKGIGGKTCLQCHENGGYVAQFKAFAPVVPHPDLIYCKQCHVPAEVSGNFKSTNWEKHPHPDIQNSAMIGSPPVIPHDLQMRENCLACHAGPAAPKEILVSHPMRINCRQCHVPVLDWENIDWNEEKIDKIKVEWKEEAK
ncbi:hypothetical protein QQ008_13055 [Fulvivirgaceae bacterium BMA10]|uniref:Periplasmic nitrate reductase, electron transfer subunit n=1 Tax=Splendidivirga corallicola TaxID=3051826 RepID=A0ABT8KQM7_9BACT|nr:hypothetical protein [Fulvivirgaceae bacterium BMA10]